MILSRFFLFCLLCFSASFVQADVSIPKLTARVTDLTDTLPASAVSALEQKLAHFEKEHSSQIAVLMVPTTQPETIEQYSLRVAEAWKIGRKKHDDGVLLLIAKNDRKVRIEVGYGLEGAIPDVIAKRIIEGILVPHFKRGDFDGGIDVALGQLMRLIQGEGLEKSKLASGYQGIDPVTVGMMVVFLMFFLNSMLRTWLSPVVSASTVSTLGTVAGWFLLGSLWGVIGIFIFCFVLTLFGGSVPLWALLNAGGGSWKGGGSGGFGGGSGSGGFSGGGGSFGGGGSSGSW